MKDAGAGVFGFFIQEAGTEYAGMFVATPGSKPTVKAGNKVDVEGDYEEVFGMSQLSNPKVTVRESGTTVPFEPVVIDPAVYASAASSGAAGEPVEGMLCVVNGPVAVSMVNADTTGDFDEFAVSAANLRVDDNLYDALDNTYAIGTTFQTIVGVCGYSYSARKVWPRSAADIVQ